MSGGNSDTRALVPIREEEGIELEGQPADLLSDRTSSVNLRAAYPVSHRSVFSRSWLWILVFLILTALLSWGEEVAAHHPDGVGLDRNPLLSVAAYERFSFYAFYAGLLLLSLKIIYEELYQMTLYYGIEAEHFVITTGVLMKRRSTLHISLITDIFLQRSLVELILLLYSVQVANPSNEGPPPSKIRSFSRANAVGIQDLLVTLIKESRHGPKLGEEEVRELDKGAHRPAKPNPETTL